MSAGQFIVPLCLGYLVEEEGFRGSCIIYGGIILNTIVAGAVLHPVKWHMKYPKKEEKKEEELIPKVIKHPEIQKVLEVDEGRSRSRSVDSMLKAKEVHRMRRMDYTGRTRSKDSIKLPEMRRLRETGSIRSKNSIRSVRSVRSMRSVRSVGSNVSLKYRIPSDLHLSQSSVALSSINLSDFPLEKELENEVIEEVPVKLGKCSAILKIIKDVSIKIIDYLKILRYARAVIMAMGLSCFLSGYINFIMQIPFQMTSKGFDLEQSAWAISTAGMTNMSLRVLISIVSDWPKFNKKLCYMVGAFIASVATVSKLILAFYHIT